MRSTNEATQWHTWAVSEPTLVIVDHLAHRARAVRNAICALSHSTNIRAPLRFLLLERVFGSTDPWTSDFVPALDPELISFFDSAHGASDNFADTTLQDTVRVLGALASDETQRILAAASSSSEDTRAASDELLETLLSIDPQRRPLFAILVARSLQDLDSGSASNHLSSRTELLNRILRREFRLWREQLEIGSQASEERRRSFEQHLNLVAFATAVGRFQSQDLELLRENNADVPVSLDPQFLRMMTGVADDFGREIYPLQPDLLGQLFVLERLAGALTSITNRSVTSERTNRFLSLAFAHHPGRMSFFIKRCLQDMAQHPALPLLAQFRIPEADFNIGLYMDHCAHYSWVATAAESAGRLDMGEAVWSNLIEHGEERSFDVLFEPRRRLNIAKSYHNRATMRVKRDEYDTARDDFTTALEYLEHEVVRQRGDLDAERIFLCAACHLGRALIEQSKQRWPEAERDLTAVIEQQQFVPVSIRANALLTRAEVREATERLELAKQDFEAICALADSDVASQKGTARERLFELTFDLAISGEESNPARALQDYGNLLDVAAGDPDRIARVSVNRSALYLRLGRFPECVADCTTVLELADAPVLQKLKASNNRGFALLALGQYELSRADLRVLERHVNSTHELFESLIVLQANHRLADQQPAAAIALLQKVLESPGLDPGALPVARQMLTQLLRPRSGV